VAKIWEIPLTDSDGRTVSISYSTEILTEVETKPVANVSTAFFSTTWTTLGTTLYVTPYYAELPSTEYEWWSRSFLRVLKANTSREYDISDNGDRIVVSSPIHFWTLNLPRDDGRSRPPFNVLPIYFVQNLAYRLLAHSQQPTLLTKASVSCQNAQEQHQP
jgi:hypothetical protein